MIRKLGNWVFGVVAALWLNLVAARFSRSRRSRAMSAITAIAFFFLAAGSAYGQGVLMQLPPLTDSLGHPIAGATISVFTATGTLPSLTCSTPVTVYMDEALTVPFTALTTDGSGNFPFFIQPSSNPYGYTISGAGTNTSICYGFSAPVSAGSSPSFATITVSQSGKFTETTAPTPLAGFDFLWADSTDHRLKANNNNGTSSDVALLADNLGAFGSTTSAQLAAVISDETGSGAAVFANSPALVTPSLGAATADLIDGFVWADRAAGADCGARINAAFATAGTTGKVLVRPACGTTWTTAVTVPASSTLEFYGCGTYTLSHILTAGQNATIKGPQMGNTNPCVELKEANSVNLAELVSLTTGQVDISGVIIDGNKSNNTTQGVGILSVGSRHFIHDLTVQNFASHCVKVSSTSQTLDESASTTLDNVIALSCNGDGLYNLNTNDVFVNRKSEFENDGITATVNTSGTAVTATAGSWSTDSSLVGTLVRINGSYFVVSAIGSTTTMTLASSAGTHTGVGLQWGNGIECHDCAAMRFHGGDVGNVAQDAVLIYGDSSTTGVSENIITGTQQGNLNGNGIKVIGYDVTSNASQVATATVIETNVITATTTITNNTYSGVAIQDSSQNIVSGNWFSTGPSASHEFVGAVSVTETSSGRDINESVTGNQVNGFFQVLSTFPDGVNCNTASNCASVVSCNNTVNNTLGASCKNLQVTRTLNILGGVGNDTAGFKHKRVNAGCATAASVGAVCPTTITWTTAFPDANYTVSCMGAVITSGVPVLGAITARSASSISVNTMALTAAAAQFTNIECTAVHDPI